VDDVLSSFEIFLAIFACVVAMLLALSEVRRVSGHKLWWKMAAIECAITGFILMLWLTIALVLRIVELVFGT
jgi:hypothetical protein